MSLTKKFTAILLVLAMLFAFSSCMGMEEETEELDIGTINIGIIYNGDMEEEGTLANKHFAAFQTAFDSAGAGGSQINQRDGVTPGDAEAMDKTMNDLISRGCRLIITADAGYYNDALKFAKENPSIFFVAMNEYGAADVQEITNFATYNIRTFEAEYLEGMMAAASSVNGKIGYVASTENATEVNAFANGAKSVNPDASVSLVVTDDIKAGIDKVTAAGCDTVYSMNYEIDEEGNRFFNVPESVKYDMCVNTLGNNGKFVSASCLNLDRLYTKIITDTVNEKFEDIKYYSTGIKEGVVDVRPTEDAALQAKVNAEKDNLFAGTSNIEKLVSTSVVLYTLVK